MAESRKRKGAGRLDFSFDTQVSAQVRKELLDTLSDGNEAVRRALSEELERRDVRGEFAQTMRPLGLRANNLIDALTGYWVVMWAIMAGADLPTREQASSVHRQVRQMIRGSPLIGRPSQRQMVGEAMLYEAMLAYGAYREAREAGDDDRLREMASTARTNMLRRGFDPTRIKVPDTVRSLH